MRAFIFDFDGVVVDSERWWDPLMEALCARLIPTWRAGDNARLLTGANLQDNYACLRKEYDLSISQEEFEADIEKLIETIYGEKARLIPGVRELIRRLHEARIPIGLASSSKAAWIDRALDRLGLAEAFPIRVTGDDLKPGEGKPAPTLYLRAAAMLAADPEDCVAIEDSRHGVASAKAAGMYCIGLRNGMNEMQDLSQADEIVASLDGVDVASLSS